MKASAALGSAVLALVILAIIAGCKKSDSDESQRMKEAHAANMMKQEIVSLKSRQIKANPAQKTVTEIALQPEFETALRAELKGDEQVANKDYAAAIKLYSEALSNFKKVLGKFETDSLSQMLPEPATNRGNIKQNSLATPAAEVADEIKKLSQKSLERERQLLAAAEARRIADQKKTPVFATEPPIPITTPKAEKNADASLVAAVAKAGNPPEKEEAKSNGNAKPEEIAATIQDIGNGKTPDKQLAPAETSNVATSGLERGAQPETQSKEQWEESVRRAIANLIGVYQNSLASKNLGGLKTLFRGNFASQHEKAWSDFFAQATDLRASIEGKNYKIDASRSEVDLVITIQYSNRKGISQKPLRYSEGWTLEQQNGNWIVAARRLE